MSKAAQRNFQAELADAMRLYREGERLLRREDAERRQAERERLDALEQPVAQLAEHAQTMTAAFLALAGFQRHDRGEWRRRRA